MRPEWLAAHARPLASLGYALVLTLCYTTLLALGYWWLRHSRPCRSPFRRHTLACGALALSVVLGGATWLLLASAPAETPQQTVVASQRTAPNVGASVMRAQPLSTEYWSGAARFVGFRATNWMTWGAVLWGIGAGALLIRLIGGVLVTVRVRRRSVILSSGPVHDAAKSLAPKVGFRRPFEVVESLEVDCPAATGWRRAGLIVPCELDASLSPRLLAPVIAHELEHLRGRDQWVALSQSIADALLFFCPGARYLSNQAREAREHRCDDVAVDTCGSSNEYATALGLLARRSSGTWQTAFMGVQAPSVTSRIRRLLKGDTMTRMNLVQRAGLIAAVVAISVTTALVLSASLQAARTAQQQELASASAPVVPFGFAQRQEGSPLSITRVAGDSEYCFSRIALRNISEHAVATVTFVAVLEHRDGITPVMLLKSQPVPVALAPGAAGEVTVPMLPIRDVLDWKVSRGVRAQPFLGVIEVGFADGDKWAFTPAPDATTEDAALRLRTEPAEISRALVGTGQPGKICRDDLGRAYSPGAMVRIKGEVGTFATCVGGIWVEQKSNR